MDVLVQGRSTVRGRGMTAASAHARDRLATSLCFGRAETFKKSSCAAGSKLVGRHVAKDMKECVGLQPTKTILLNHSTRTEVGSASTGAGDAFDRKLTSAQPVSRKSKARARKTNIRLGAIWMKSRLKPGLAREMQYDADV
ncbi:hypothetical protein SR870_05885 [Rhodopseudomonas palustris]|uniref:hypothetical protein n=1 Tax=Rhodopseudomonas palustris TaxID=1076 RepID=UPI002ACD36E4|nr:hypothetical protein [Rhodopseudomonas palustris]WQH00807.1 hypothetical protein SR870_05885 [Rhodopseudomonas palustris]